jgi:SAM-dependent methyltransferase
MTDYLAPYHQAHRRHGSGFDVTMWATPSTQQKRFAVFADTLFLTGKRILDAGCSRGDLAAWLLQREMVFERYTGIDGLAEVIVFARDRHLKNCEFIAGDFVADPSLLHINQPQITLVSGTLNTMDDDTALRVLQAAWQGCSEALGFNFLSDLAGPEAVPQQYPARRLPTMHLLGWALSQTPDVVFRQDYFPHGHDATVVMRKVDPQPAD